MTEYFCGVYKRIYLSLVILQRRKHCLCTLFLHLSWIMIYFRIGLSTKNNPVNGQYPNCDSTNPFKRILFSFSKFMQFEILDKVESFLPTFLHKLNTWSSKFRFLSIVNPSNCSFLLSQILVSPMLAHKVSCLCPATSRWHLSLFNFM